METAETRRNSEGRRESRAFLLSLIYTPHNNLQDDIWGAASGQDYQTVAAISGEPVIGTMLPALETPGRDETPTFRLSPKGVSAYELWQVQKKRRELRQEYLDHWLGTEKVTGTGRSVDAIICPVAPYVAPPHGMNR